MMDAKHNEVLLPETVELPFDRCTHAGLAAAGEHERIRALARPTVI
jgi:hypothetical protein